MNNTEKTFSLMDKETGNQITFGIGKSKLSDDNIEQIYVKTFTGSETTVYFYFSSKEEALAYLEEIRKMLEE